MMDKRMLLGVTLMFFSLMLASEQRTVEVNLHGVNYSEKEFRFYVVDSSSSTSGGGELIDPFGAGGITCCATLPKNWQPGTKLEVRTVHWLKRRPDGTRPEIREVHQVEIPRYATGKPGELWLLREADGKISAVSSDLQPNHPRWPGKIKGWPIPSLEYRREKWEITRKHEEDGLSAAVEVLNELEKSPATVAKKIWETEKEYSPKSVAGFSGPNDPRYLSAVTNRIKQGLIQTKQRLKEIVEAKP
jgi:hypothetical protein